MRSYDVTVFDRPLQKNERPTPQPSGEEVLVKVTAAGVCHSDLHICEGFFDLGGGKKLEMGARGVNLPLTMGHEIAGEIVVAGPDSETVTPGKKVVVFPWIGCGKCPICQRGDEQNCSRPRSLGIYRGGGYATHVLVPHARYLLDCRRPAARGRRALCLLGAHHLQRLEEARRARAQGGADPDHRRRRARPHVPRHHEGARRAWRCRRGHRCRQARGGDGRGGAWRWSTRARPTR